MHLRCFKDLTEGQGLGGCAIYAMGDTLPAPLSCRVNAADATPAEHLPRRGEWRVPTLPLRLLPRPPPGRPPWPLQWL